MSRAFLAVLAALPLGFAAISAEPDGAGARGQHSGEGATRLGETEDESCMLQSHAAGVKRAVRFEAGPGARLGRFRLIKLLSGEQARKRPVLSQVEWPEEFEDDFASKYGEGTLLGRGGQGEVWKAEDPSTGTPVAVKIYINRTSEDEWNYLNWDSADEKQRKALLAAKSECDLMMMLGNHAKQDPVGHSHVMRCFESHILPEGDSSLPAYSVLELGGDDLEKWLQQQSGTLGDSEEARKLVAHILQALRFLQSQDPPILHRDLKPENVLLQEGPSGGSVAKIFDFGCALNGTEEGQHSEFHYTCYTPQYAPLEVAARRCRDDPDRQVAFEMPTWSFDIRSVGMMYWQMLCPNIASANGDTLSYFQFMCAPPPLGHDGHIEGVLRSLFDSKTPAGDPKCPNVSDDEVLLIESMLGPYEKRPSPSDILKFPLLAKHVS